MCHMVQCVDVAMELVLMLQNKQLHAVAGNVQKPWKSVDHPTQVLPPRGHCGTTPFDVTQDSSLILIYIIYTRHPRTRLPENRQYFNNLWMIL